MSYKEQSFFRDILVTEIFYIATKDKKMIRAKDSDYICAWTDRDLAESYLKDAQVPYDKIHEMDIDRFATYEVDEVFDKGDHVLINPSADEEGTQIDIVEVTEELMTELDNIRVKEFAKDVAKEDSVYGLTRKDENHFIMIGDKPDEKPHIMPVWSIRNRAAKVRDHDFEECEVIEIEGEVFAEWLDELRDDDNAVGVDLKAGVVGTVVSAQTLADEMY